jgi:hypothetical protein
VDKYFVSLISQETFSDLLKIENNWHILFKHHGYSSNHKSSSKVLSFFEAQYFKLSKSTENSGFNFNCIKQQCPRKVLKKIP